MFIPAALHSVANFSTACWGSSTEQTNRTASFLHFILKFNGRDLEVLSPSPRPSTQDLLLAQTHTRTLDISSGEAVKSLCHRWASWGEQYRPAGSVWTSWSARECRRSSGWSIWLRPDESIICADSLVRTAMSVPKGIFHFVKKLLAGWLCRKVLIHG